MDERLPRGVPLDPVAGAAPRKRRNLRLMTDTQNIAVADIWEDGFSLESDGPQPRHGFVDLLEGGTLLRRGLAYRTGEAGGRSIYAFKSARDAALEPPRDYARGGEGDLLGEG